MNTVLKLKADLKEHKEQMSHRGGDISGYIDYYDNIVIAQVAYRNDMIVLDNFQVEMQTEIIRYMENAINKAMGIEPEEG